MAAARIEIDGSETLLGRENSFFSRRPNGDCLDVYSIGESGAIVKINDCENISLLPGQRISVLETVVVEGLSENAFRAHVTKKELLK